MSNVIKINLINYFIQITKNNLKEKNEVLESTREELVICRSEIETLKIVPANELCKGNFKINYYI